MVPDVDHSPIFTMQSVDDGVGGQLLVLYDSGALTSAIKESTAKRLRAHTIRKGPIKLSVVGGEATVAAGGVKGFTLPLTDGRIVAISAIAMAEITAPIAKYHTGEALSDLEKEFKRTNPGAELPEVDEVVGGRSADLLLGAEYSFLFPQADTVHALSSGLAVGRAKLHSRSGKQGVLWGVHKSFDDVAPAVNAAHLVREELRAPLPPLLADNQSFIYHSREEFCAALHADTELERVEIEGEGEGEGVLVDGTYKCSAEHGVCREEDPSEVVVAIHSLQFGSDEALTAAQSSALADAAVAVSYRCPTCRACSSCKDEGLEARSIAEDREQAMIDGSVEFDPGEGKLTARLPFIKDPARYLHNNRHVALKVLERNFRKLQRKPEERQEVIQSFRKLYDRGYICKISDLSADERSAMDGSLIPSLGYHIPWQVVRKATSVSTPVRIVMNAASRTPGGSSLNDLLAKGHNSVTSLFASLVCFRLGDGALSADIAKFYNQTQLEASYLQYQRILWPRAYLAEGGKGGGEGEELEAVEMVVKTLIYGLRPSGQQCTAGMAKLAAYVDQQRPDLAAGAAAVRAAYVDDILSPATPGKERELARQISEVLGLAGMQVKGFAVSGEDPPAELSADGETVGVLGYSWQPKHDLLSLEKKTIDLIPNKGKIVNPRPSLDQQFQDKRLFTKRSLLSLSLRLFDPLGLFCPVYGEAKLAIQEVVTTTDGWDTPVADKYKPTFRSIINTLTQIPSIHIPRPAVKGGEGGIELLVFADASQSLMCAAVYARTVDSTGRAHTQLLCAKQRLSQGSSIPRSELKAICIATSLGYTIQRKCNRIESVRVLTDSAIALQWILSDHRPLSANVRNSVLEVRRLIELTQLYHVRSADNLADIGTKPASLEDVKADSTWFLGHAWMRDQPDEWPVTPASKLAPTEKDRAEAGREMKSSFGVTILTVAGGKQADHEDLLVDPVALGWERAVNITNKVISIIKKWRKNYRGPETAIDYFAVKSTELLEARKSHKELEKAGGVKENNVWIFNARYLNSGLGELDGIEAECLDVRPDMFRTPMALADSKVGLAVMTHCHQLSGHHRGVNATLVESLSVFHILGGRKLAKTVRSACPRCIHAQRRTLEQHLGPLHKSRLLIAPAFTWPAMDIAGPFKVRCACGSNHRASAKAYILVIRCPSTNAVSAEVMETLSSASAADAYSRHASRYGHAQWVTSDRGSQFMALWRKGSFSHTDLTTRLQSEYERGGIRVTVVPAAHHSANGVAERAIRTVREMMNEVFRHRSYSVLQLQTFAYYVCNVINGIPFALDKAAAPDNLDAAIICPNRLLLGHANRRALAAPVRAGNLDEHVELVDKVEQAFHRTWTQVRISQFVNGRRAEKEKDTPINVGDIVIFAKLPTEMKAGSSPLRIARVRSVEPGSLGRIRSVTLEYKTKPSKTYQTTVRSPTQLTVIAKMEKVEDHVLAEPPDGVPIEQWPTEEPPMHLEDEFEPEHRGGVQDG